MGWYLTVLSKSLEFTGRARRTEYWTFWAVSCAISIALGMLPSLFRFLGNETVSHLIANIGSFYSWAVWLPGLAAGARRMHDTGRSGWWQLVPLVGQVMLFFDGEHHDNEYGADPRLPLLESGTKQSPQLE